MTDVSEGSGRFDSENDPVFSRTGICHQCRHQFANKLSCAAFPEGIPEAIVFGDVMHTTRYPGDRNIQFEPIVQ